MERKKKHDFDEIYDYVVLLNQVAQKTYGKKLSNIVFMGMGEPLLNYKNVLKAIERITSPDGLGMSPRRITVSTAGGAKKNRDVGGVKGEVKYALSLFSTNKNKPNLT